MTRARVSHPDDVYELAPKLREADLKELEAAGTNPVEALERGYQFSFPYCWTVDHGSRPIAMFGVVPVEPRLGAIWLLGSDDIVRIRSRFLRECREWLAKIERGYDAVFNVVHQDNHVHIRWLRWMGFTFIRRVPPFIEFAKLCVHPSSLSA